MILVYEVVSQNINSKSEIRVYNSNNERIGGKDVEWNYLVKIFSKCWYSKSIWSYKNVYFIDKICLHVYVEGPGITVGIYLSRSCLRIYPIVYALMCDSTHTHNTHRKNTCNTHTHRGWERERTEIYKHWTIQIGFINSHYNAVVLTFVSSEDKKRNRLDM